MAYRLGLAMPRPRNVLMEGHSEALYDAVEWIALVFVEYALVFFVVFGVDDR